MPHDLAAELLIEVPSEALTPPPQPRAKQPRLRRLAEPFVRVRVSWFTTDPRARGIHPRERLLLLLLHLSRWGQQPVTLTSAVTEQIGITRQERLRLLGELEEFGWIQVTRAGQKALVVCPIVAGQDRPGTA